VKKIFGSAHGATIACSSAKRKARRARFSREREARINLY